MSETTEKTNKESATSSFEGAFSNAMKHFQDIEKEYTTAARRVAGAILNGIESWEQKREESASEKKEGFDTTSLSNMQEVFSNTLKETVEAQKDLMTNLHEKIKEKTKFAN